MCNECTAFDAPCALTRVCFMQTNYSGNYNNITPPFSRRDTCSASYTACNLKVCSKRNINCIVLGVALLLWEKSGDFGEAWAKICRVNIIRSNTIKFSAAASLFLSDFSAFKFLRSSEGLEP